MSTEKILVLITGLAISFILTLPESSAQEGESFAQDHESIALEGESFLDQSRVVYEPAQSEEYSPESRRFTGIPSIAVTEQGRIWATWYAGRTPEEDSNNYVVVATSADQGESWKEVLVIDPDGKGAARAFDPEIWIDPDGKLRVFWSQATPDAGTWDMIVQGNPAGVWTMLSSNPDAQETVWSKPERLTDGVMMCKPIVSSSGEWILPVSIWRLVPGHAQMVVSRDKGKTWELRGAATVPDDQRSFDEHIILEKKDKSYWMLLRTQYGIGESESSDRGQSWSPVTPSAIQHPSARFFIRRLNSGNLLLVKHGPIDQQTDRSQLMAFISGDEGKTWSKGLMLDERTGVSYPDGQQTDDGSIYIIYDFNRREDQNILMVVFREEDLDPDTEESSRFLHRVLVSKGGL